MQAATAHQHHWHAGNSNDPVFVGFLNRLQARFAERVGEGEPLFTTDAHDLWSTYLAAFPADTRQSHNCNACHHFIRRYAGLVTIAADGTTQPAFWEVDDAPEEYRAAIAQIFLRVKRAKVTGVFLSGNSYLGSFGGAEEWVHYGLTQRNAAVFKSKIETAGQAMAKKHEDFGTVLRAIAEYSTATLDTALTLLKSDALYRSEKVLGQAEWLREVAAAWYAAPNALRARVLWRAIATAPAGFCHPRSSMIGTLLDDINAGLPFADVSRRFADKESTGKLAHP